MRKIQRVRTGWPAAVVLGCTLLASAALAATATTTERPGSILIFPKVVTTGSRDTVIQITNTGNMPDDLHCFYLNGQSCFETDFGVSLTKQQPTAWDVGSGRAVNPRDGQSGLDPGLIPPLPKNFAGALICAEFDSSDAPTVLNQVKGEATIVDNSQTSTVNNVSKYNAIAIQGDPTNSNGDNVLKLNGTAAGGGEYAACPASLILNFQRGAGPDPIIESLGNGGRCDSSSTNSGDPCNSNADCSGGTCQVGQSRVLTRLTVLPCTLDLATLTATKVTLTLDGKDENEVSFSGAHSFTCWDSFTVDSSVVQPGTANATMAIRGDTPVLGIAESFHSDSVANTASAAVNLHMQGVCVGGTQNRRECNRDFECPGGSCSTTGAATTITLPPE